MSKQKLSLFKIQKIRKEIKINTYKTNHRGESYEIYEFK